MRNIIQSEQHLLTGGWGDLLMKVKITVKQAGRRKNYLTEKELSITDVPSTLRQLITEIVRLTVNEYNSRPVGSFILHYLSPEDINIQSQTGKVGFGERKHKGQTDEVKAIAAAILAFEDGLYRVFIGEEEVTALDDVLILNNAEVLTFVRFTMLSGRMW